jgi:hypothetical protein
LPGTVGAGVGALLVVSGGIQELMVEKGRGLEDQHDRAEILLLENVEEVVIAIFCIMITKIVRIVGKVGTGKMELPDTLLPMRVLTILLRVVDLMKLV